MRLLTKQENIQKKKMNIINKTRRIIRHFIEVVNKNGHAELDLGNYANYEKLLPIIKKYFRKRGYKAYKTSTENGSSCFDCVSCDEYLIIE